MANMYLETFIKQAVWFQALAHERRLEILMLLDEQEVAVSGIYSMLDLPQANVSQHLKVLKDAGLVTTQRLGKQIYYRVSSREVLKVVEAVRKLALGKGGGYSMEQALPVVKDAVCGMRVSTKLSPFKATFRGKTYYFCASGCLKKFKEEPQQYV